MNTTFPSNDAQNLTLNGSETFRSYLHILSFPWLLIIYSIRNGNDEIKALFPIQWWM